MSHNAGDLVVDFRSRIPAVNGMLAAASLPVESGRPVPARFQFEAVRDVVGILRVMYREERDKRSPSPIRMQKIERLAREFLAAYRMASVHDPDTAPYVRACKQAEGAALRLGDLATVIDPIEPVLRVASERVIGAASRRSEGEYRWAVGRKPR